MDTKLSTFMFYYGFIKITLIKIISVLIISLATIPMFYQPWHNLPGDWLRIVLFIVLFVAGLWRISAGLFLFLVLLPTSTTFTIITGYPYLTYSFIEFAGWGLAASASIKLLLLRNTHFRFSPIDLLIGGFWFINTISLFQVLMNFPGPLNIIFFHILSIGIRDLGWRSQIHALYPLHQWYLLTLCLIIIYIFRFSLYEKSSKAWTLRGAYTGIGLSIFLSLVYLVFPIMNTPRYSGFFVDTNQYACYMFSLLSGTVATLLIERNRWKLWTLFALILMIVFFIPLTFSKMTLLASFILLVVYYLIYAIRHHRMMIGGIIRKIIVSHILFILITIGGLVTIVTSTLVRDNEISKEYKSVSSYFVNAMKLMNINTTMKSLYRGRFFMWLASEGMIREYPLSGVGIGRYLPIKPIYTPAPLQDNNIINIPMENSHNTFLQIAAELGLPALLLFLLIIIAMLIGAILTVPYDWLVYQRTMTALFILMAMVLNFLTADNYLVPEIQMLFWLAIATLLAGVRFPRWTWWACLFTALILVAIFTAGIIIEPSKPVSPGFTDRVGTSYKEISNLGFKFRWLDRVAAWKEELKAGRRMIAIGPGPQGWREDNIWIIIGSAFKRKIPLNKYVPFVALDFIVLKGDHADGKIQFAYLGPNAASPLCLGINNDPRFMSAQLIEPFNDEELEAYCESVPEFRSLFYFQEERPEGGKLIWYSRDLNIVIDGYLNEISLSVLINNPDLKQKPVTIQIKANNEVVQNIVVKYAHWLSIPINTSRLPIDSVITIAVDRNYVPYEEGHNSDSRRLGFAIDLDRLYTREK